MVLARTLFFLLDTTFSLEAAVLELDLLGPTLGGRGGSLSLTDSLLASLFTAELTEILESLDSLEVSLRVSLELSLRVSLELSLKVSLEVSLRVSLEVSLRESLELSLRVSLEVSLRESLSSLALLLREEFLTMLELDHSLRLDMVLARTLRFFVDWATSRDLTFSRLGKGFSLELEE